MRSRKEKSSYQFVCLGLVFLIGLGIFGCNGTTISPTEPATDDPSDLVPIATATPDRDAPVNPKTEGDNYAETPTDPTVETLEPDEEPYTVTMDYTGDIDWYKIRIPSTAKIVNISLTEIPQKSDFDMVAYDADLKELTDGRSAQAGDTSENLTLSPPFDAVIYLQIYSYTGRGEAALTLSTTEGTTEEEIKQLSYEKVLSTYYPLYPRGTRARLLERSVETIQVEQISCQTSGGLQSGELMLGNYAHVGRELLNSEDYIDGWAVVVFNGPVSVLENLTVRIRVTIFAPSLDLEIQVPSEMTIQGSSYLVSETENGVYYLSRSYGDLWENTTDDIRISSGVVGDLGDLFANNIFTQQVEVEWQWSRSGTTSCSGSATGESIVDFETANALFLSHYLR